MRMIDPFQPYPMMLALGLLKQRKQSPQTGPLCQTVLW